MGSHPATTLRRRLLIGVAGLVVLGVGWRLTAPSADARPVEIAVPFELTKDDPAAGPSREETTLVEGTLGGSVYEMAERAGADPALISQMLRLFAQRVDFARDVRAGDTFRLAFERAASPDGRTVQTGALIYAEIAVRTGVVRLYAFPAAGGFFDDQGRGAQGLLLRTPIDGARITSLFGERFHPILGYTRMHQGVDFAAAVGAPVVAAGDGEVVEEGAKGGYGERLMIRHAGGWQTAYAHLSAFAAGVIPGAYVRQGQVIGFVGRTGLATGPHLHYEVWRGGAPVNPLSADAPLGATLTGYDLAAFEDQRARIDALRLTAGSHLAQSSAPGAAGLRGAL